MWGNAGREPQDRGSGDTYGARPCLPGQAGFWFRHGMTMAIVTIVTFVCGAPFGGAASILVILAYGMLHARRSRRAEVSVAGPTPQYKAPRRVAKIPAV